MENKQLPGKKPDSVTSVFKNGTMPTREEYTRLWIRLINQMEREKGNL